MRISFDLDGVIIDHSQNKILLAKDYGVNLSLADIFANGIKNKFRSSEDYQDFKKKLYNEISLSAKPVTGAKKYIKKFSNLSDDLWIISRRIDFTFAEKWISRHLGGIFEQSHIVFVKNDSGKDAVCRRKKIQLHIDDSSEVIDTLFSVPFKVFFNPSGMQHPSAEASVRNWKEFFNFYLSISRKKIKN